MKISNNDLLISILIPVFNGERYLYESIDSALGQTYRNCEVIVVDDGSTDNTEEICLNYGDKIRYFKKNNGGVSTALNLGIREAKGEYISWLSHDDLYHPEKIEKQVKAIAKLPENERGVAIVISNLQVINEDSRPIDNWAIHKVHDTQRFENPLYPVMKGLVHGCTLLIPKKLIIEAGGFDETLKTSQDYDLWFKIFPKAKISFLKDNLVRMRRHEGQGTFSDRAVKESNAIWIKMMKEITEADMTSIDGDVPNFYRQMELLMSRVGYIEAAIFAHNRLSQLS